MSTVSALLILIGIFFIIGVSFAFLVTADRRLEKKKKLEYEKEMQRQIDNIFVQIKKEVGQKWDTYFGADSK